MIEYNKKIKKIGNSNALILPKIYLDNIKATSFKLIINSDNTITIKPNTREDK